MINKGKKEAGNSREIRAIIPGAIVEVRVRKGEKVTTGDVVIVLEAMKMLNTIEVPMDGKIKKIHIDYINKCLLENKTITIKQLREYLILKFSLTISHSHLSRVVKKIGF